MIINIPGKTSRRRDENEEYGGGEGEYGEGGGDEEGEQPAGGYSYGDEGEGEAEEALWWDYLLNEYKCNSQKENKILKIE